MVKHFIIDGNNLIGYNKDIKKIEKYVAQSSRGNLVVMLQKYFYAKKVNVSLFFDGFENERISSGKIKIYYSNTKTADDLIRNEISKSRNPKNICLVSSDLQLCEFAKKNSCAIKSSPDFWKDYYKTPTKTEKENIENFISNDEIMKLFGLK